MATVRVQYQFVDTSDSISNGWTENFYYSASDAPAALNVVGSLPRVNLRTAVMGADYRLTQIRCVTVGMRNDVAVQSYTPAQGQGKFTTGDSEMFNSEQPWDALLWRLTSISGFNRSFLMRGIPTGIFQDTFSIGTAQPAYLNNMSLLANYIGGTGHASNFQLRHLTYPANVPCANVAIVNGNRALQFTVTAPAPPWLVAKALVRMRGITTVATNPNHLWRVQDVTVIAGSPTVTLFPGRRTMYGIPTGPIVVDQVTPQFDFLSNMVGVRGTKKSTGRPPALLRGRALVRRA